MSYLRVISTVWWVQNYFHNLDDETRARVYELGMRGGGGVNTSQREWAVGELEFEALMRMLDNSVSKNPDFKKNQNLKTQNEEK